MAQWNGQYTGNTHGTKVADLEDTLRHAVEVFKNSSADVKSSKGKAVKKLAAKLLNARLKMLKAKLADTTPVEAKNWEKRRIQIEHLEIQEKQWTSSGVSGILSEFGVDKLVTDEEAH